MTAASRGDRYQLAGLDDRQRGFSRPVALEPAGDGFRAVLRYERVVLSSESHPTQDEALHVLIHALHRQGFRRLKSQMSVRNGIYLGSQELWIEYPDPQEPSERAGFLARVTGWFRRSGAGEDRP